MLASGIGHAPGEQSELTRDILLQTLDQNISLSDNFNAGLGERVARCRCIFDQEMSNTFSFHDPRATAFDADARAAERFTHFRKCAGPILQNDGEIFHFSSGRAPLSGERRLVWSGPDRKRGDRPQSVPR